MLINAFKCPKRKRTEDGARLVLVVPSDRITSSEHKLKHRKFPEHQESLFS